MFEKLLSPITIRDVTINGRAMLSACGTRFSDDRIVNDRHIAYHVAKVKGGCPLNMIEVTGVHPGSDASMFLSLAKDEYVPGVKRLVDAIHEAGGKAGIQIYQGGLGVCFDSECPMLMPDLMDEEEILDVIEAFGHAARRAVEAGVDLIEIHCAHQYLIHSFLSPAFNHRSDEWGGPFENRVKFPLACIKKVRENIPEGMPLFIRTSLQDDFLSPGLSVEDCIAFCKLAKEAGVDVLDLSRGNMATAANKFEVPPVDMARGFNLELAARFKEETGMIVIGVGRINDPYVAEKALEKVDMVVMSRAQIADPEFFKKVREGRLDDINRCIGCNEGCLDGFANLEMPHISCARNPQVGLEGECPIEPAAEPKTVLIAGGGTAGMMAAKILKQEGHNPIICEASDKLGGALLLGGAIERTSEYRKAIESSARQLERAGVDIRLNTTVTPELIKQIKPDAVFCCLGAVPETPDFAKGKVNVVQARDVLAGKVHVGGKVVVIGANGTGIMAGEFVKLADPERNDVTLINRAIVVGVDLGSARKQAHATILEDESLKQSVSTDVTDIVDGKVIGVRDGETVEFPYDYAILATGCVSKDYADLENACAQLGIGFEVLGDAKEVRRAFEAAAEGFAAARRMNDPEYIKKITK